MQYRILGRTGIRVSPVCLGTMEFPLLNDEPLAQRIMDRSLELGINFIDTANNYQRGAAEDLLGRWLAKAGNRQQVVLATKVRARTGPGPNEAGLSRVHIVRAVEASLRRLRTDWTDLYIMHAPDEVTPIETTLRALDDLVHAGKVRAIGCSNFLAWELCKALWVSDVRNLARCENTQLAYNLLARGPESEVFPLCQQEQVAVTVYNPTAAGLLAGRFQWGAPPEGTRFGRMQIYQRRYWYEVNFQIVERLTPIAAQSGRTLGQFALAWVLANPTVTSILTGVETVAQLEENVAAAERPLTEEEHRAACEAATGAIVGPAVGPRFD